MRTALGSPSLSPLGPIRPITSPVVLITLPALRFSPKPPETIPVSEHSHPIYRSLRLNHFETPRHVRDQIWDSELPSVHQNTEIHNTDRHQTLSVRTLRVENYVDMTETRLRSITNSGT